MKKIYIFLFDLVVIGLMPFVALFVRYDYDVAWAKLGPIIPYQVLGTGIAALCFLSLGTYRGFWRHTALPDFTRILVAVTVAIIITLFLNFLVLRLDAVPRSLPVIQWALSILVMVGVRLVVRSTLQAPGKKVALGQLDTREHVLVVGLGDVAELYLRCASTLAGGRLVVEGLLDEDPGNRGRFLLKHKVVGCPAGLQQILAQYRVHGVTVSRIIIAVPFHELSGASRETLLHWERSGAVKLDLFEERLGFREFSSTENRRQEITVPVQGTDILRTDLEARPYLKAKRVLDILGVLLLGTLLSPLIVVAAVLVLVDVGYPVIFWQRRVGKYGMPFTLYKFRTMRSRHDGTDQYGDRDRNKAADAARMSRIGHFLRKTRMDELPQLYHILVGEMSFVGPRPLLPDYQPKNSRIRLSVTPGITGWAQIHGGDKLSADEKLALDVWYLNRMSLAMDIDILSKTVMVAVRGDDVDPGVIDNAQKEMVHMGLDIPGSRAAATGHVLKAS